MSEPRRATPRSALVLISLAVLAGALGAGLYAAGHLGRDHTLREPGLLAILVGAFLAARASVVRARALRAQPVDGGASPLPAVGTRSNRVLRRTGVAVVLVGLALFALGPFSWGIRLFGLAVAMVGILFVRNSFDPSLSASSASGGGETPKAVRRFDRAMRITGIALVPLMALSAVALFGTPVTSHELWPLYTFFVVALACVLVWAYLFGRFFVWLAVGGRRR